MSAYYNEIDPGAAAWLRELIKAKVIADGEVDTRSIVDVQPADLAGFRQCHFFAGIGGWSYALRLAGWPDDREVWTGSCPCQPFSVAGKSEGTGDPRHLWPAWFGLIAERRPATIFGEQVASSDGLYWLDLVFADLEASDYAIGAFDLPAAGAGAPHARQRLWIVADDYRQGRDRIGASRLHERRPSTRGDEPTAGDIDKARGHDADGCGEPRGLADTQHAERRPLSGPVEDVSDGRHGGRAEAHGQPGTRRQVLDLADSESRGQRADGRTPGHGGHTDERSEASTVVDAESLRGGARRAHDGTGRQGLPDGPSGASEHGDVVDAARLGSERRGTEPDRGGARDYRSSIPTQGTSGASSFWSGCDWIPCLDGKARPVEPGSFPLAHGVSARVGRLRGYGNAIVPQVAAEVIRAYMEVRR